MVSGDPARVESELAAGRLGCPGCGDRLGRWGWARGRNVRGTGGVERRVQPRRARCVGCEGTHVLLPDGLLWRRRDGAEVIGWALVAHAAGTGHRTIAARLGLPAATVRGWLRRFRARAAVIASFFARWALVLAPGSDPPAPTGARRVTRWRLSGWRRGPRCGGSVRGRCGRPLPGCAVGGCWPTRIASGWRRVERAASRLPSVESPWRPRCRTVIETSRCSGIR